MFQYSGIELNNLGNFKDCNKLDYARYVVIVLAQIVVQVYCGPKVCTASDYQSLMAIEPQMQLRSSFDTTKKLTELNLQSENLDLESSGPLVLFPKEYQDDHYKDYDDSAKVMIAFMSIISFLVVVASIAEFFLPKRLKDIVIMKALLCFSLPSNLKKLLTTRSQERLGQKDTLEILNAVRVLSIAWVIFGHVCIFAFEIPIIINIGSAFASIKEPEYILAYGGYYAVDTFFWLSGLLMAYLFIIEIEKKPQNYLFTALLAYVHRFLRITPVYMFCLLFFWRMQKYLGNGPAYILIDEHFNADCSDYWYTNLIYLNNFIPDWKSSGCLGVSWYLANDMQFFILSPIVLILYIKVHKLIGWLAVLSACICGIVSGGAMAHHFDLNVSTFAPSNGSNQFNYYYVKPYCRIPPYALGLACGMILYSYRKYQEKGTIYDPIAYFIAKTLKNIFVRCGMFFFGLALINVLIFIQYDTYHHPGDDNSYHHWSKDANYAFYALERFGYGLGISCIFLPLLLGYFKPLADFLSYSAWSFIARLNFVIYLIHLSVMQIIWKSQKTVWVFDMYGNVSQTISFFVFVSICALPIVLAIEMPAANLEKLIFARGTPKKSPLNEDFVINETLMSRINKDLKFRN
ncbi:hypothetical protein SteCoe_38101 [Stentor coeruleus]|uniref:Acyltransferase 3 domain-containing protein n=1 Tax=Stentor coeruleus TaxID=5963 RepID=A0A1R2ALU1_9CILI|nr:hypothetical protein SteCoe_38101 [Stentor coeruleus]